MGALATLKGSLATAVANNGTFTLNYPAGTTPGDLASIPDFQISVNNNDVYKNGAGASLAFGASNVTVTNLSGISWAANSAIVLTIGQTDRLGSYNLTLGSAYNQAAPGNSTDDAASQAMVASGAVNPGVQVLDLNHATVPVLATANAPALQGLFLIRNTSASGTAAHKLTLSNGTFNGTATMATLDAPGEMLVVFFDKNGRGTIVENIGTVGLS